MNINLNEFIQWQRAKEGRSVSIELGEPSDNNYIRIWVFDYNLMVGQSVTSVKEIDLEKVKEDEDRAKYEELKARFG